MHKHIVSDHAGNIEDVTFDWKVLGKFQKPLQRQLDEAINIEGNSKESSLNSKSEYYKHDRTQ